MNLLVILSATVLILALPLLGILARGGPISPYLDFPPKPVVMAHPPFSIFVFLAILIFVIICTLPFIKKGLSHRGDSPPGITGRMPLWGYAAFVSLGCVWAMAWARFEWFSILQPHTFFPLWVSWIACVNALVFRSTGQCPLLKNPAGFACLFFVSAVFWWIFEYLNRFTGNWIYSGNQYSAGTYFLLATLSFSTVLPAVESMAAYLLTFDCFKNGFKRMIRLEKTVPRPAAAGMVLVSAALLLFIGVFPDQLFFMIWISPFFIFLGCRIAFGRPHAFSGAVDGDFTNVATYAAAALVCGFFWEMFNFYSLARWEYAIPYVQVLHLFEMPVLGYAGYLPFGLECALIIDLVLNNRRNP